MAALFFLFLFIQVYSYDCYKPLHHLWIEVSFLTQFGCIPVREPGAVGQRHSLSCLSTAPIVS